MPLSPEMVQRLREKAAERGANPDDVVAAAEGLSSDKPVAEKGPADRLVAERMLIGFLPFVTVREFREIWMGLPGDVPDSELFTGEWLDIHGQQGGKASAGGDE